MRDKFRYAAKSQGNILLGLLPRPEHWLGGPGLEPTVISLSGPEGFIFPEPRKIAGVVKDGRVLKLPFQIREKTQAGHYEFLVKIRFQAASRLKIEEAQEIVLKVPVRVSGL